jgi:hypothetical protein
MKIAIMATGGVAAISVRGLPPPERMFISLRP